MILKLPLKDASIKPGQRVQPFAEWLLLALGVELLTQFQAWVGPSWGLEIVLSLPFQLIALMHPECLPAAAPNHWVIIYSQA